MADNGPPFNSAEFRDFCAKNKIEYCNSPPYHPQSNGWAERAVRTAKASIKKMVTDTKTKLLPIELKVDNFLFKYRNTPVTTTNVTPNSMMFIFRTRTLISIMSNKSPTETMTTKLNRPAHKQRTTISKKTKECPFAKHDLIVYKSESRTTVRWIRAKIIEVISPCRFKIKLLHDGTVKISHGDQLRKFNVTEHETVVPPTFNTNLPEAVESSASSNYTSDEEEESSSEAIYSSASDYAPNNVDEASQTEQQQRSPNALNAPMPATRFSNRNMGKDKPSYKETRLRKYTRK